MPSVLFTHGYCSFLFVIGEDKVPGTVAAGQLRVYSGWAEV